MKNVTLSGNIQGQNAIASFFKENRNSVVEVISALFILLFAYTGISKLLDIERFTFVLNESPLINTRASIFAYSVPVVEFAVSTFLFIPALRRWGLYLSLALMCLFTLYLSYMIMFTPNRPCSCGGVISQMTWKQHLIFNLFFVGLAFWGTRLLKYK